MALVIACLLVAAIKAVWEKRVFLLSSVLINSYAVWRLHRKWVWTALVLLLCVGGFFFRAYWFNVKRYEDWPESWEGHYRVEWNDVRKITTIRHEGPLLWNPRSATMSFLQEGKTMQLQRDDEGNLRWGRWTTINTGASTEKIWKQVGEWHRLTQKEVEEYETERIKKRHAEQDAEAAARKAAHDAEVKALEARRTRAETLVAIIHWCEEHPDGAELQVEGKSVRLTKFDVSKRKDSAESELKQIRDVGNSYDYQRIFSR